MSYRRIYCALAYRRQGRGFEPHKQESFVWPELALHAGEQMAQRSPCVLVYSVDVDPDIDAVSNPRLLARHGGRETYGLGVHSDTACCARSRSE